MRSPAEMTVIQIDITNACTRRCANCTRFCGHHAQPYFMDFETFKKAVASMTGFPGIVGIMGGEPTIHPDFEKFIRHFADNFGTDIDETIPMYHPTANFIQYITENAFDFRLGASNQRGLFSSIGKKYYENFELIQDIFGLQCLNDHTHPSLHTSLMCTRRELGISDQDWFPLRDQCWIQNTWSASITPKGAFFCEVAAALDTTFGGPGGWPVEPGWWRRTPEEFGDQLRWCERCSACLPVPRRNANEETDDISPFYFEELKRINSRKLNHDHVSIVDLATYDPERYLVIEGEQPYLDDDLTRVHAGQRMLKPHSVIFMESSGAVPAAADDWVAVLTDPAGGVKDALEAAVANAVFNPGCLYGFLDADRKIAAWFFNTIAHSLRGVEFRNIPFGRHITSSYPKHKIVGLPLPTLPTVTTSVPPSLMV